MGKWGYNPFTNRLDKVRSDAELDDRYVNKTGDTMTGELTLSPVGDTALTADKDIVLKAGQKLILDGA